MKGSPSRNRSEKNFASCFSLWYSSLTTACFRSTHPILLCRRAGPAWKTVPKYSNLNLKSRKAIQGLQKLSPERHDYWFIMSQSSKIQCPCFHLGLLVFQKCAPLVSTTYKIGLNMRSKTKKWYSCMCSLKSDKNRENDTFFCVLWPSRCFTRSSFAINNLEIFFHFWS